MFLEENFWNMCEGKVLMWSLNERFDDSSRFLWKPRLGFEALQSSMAVPLEWNLPHLFEPRDGPYCKLRIIVFPLGYLARARSAKNEDP